jgi:hypothetical protein
VLLHHTQSQICFVLKHDVRSPLYTFFHQQQQWTAISKIKHAMSAGGAGMRQRHSNVGVTNFHIVATHSRTDAVPMRTCKMQTMQRNTEISRKTTTLPIRDDCGREEARTRVAAIARGATRHSCVKTSRRTDGATTVKYVDLHTGRQSCGLFRYRQTTEACAASRFSREDTANTATSACFCTREPWPRHEQTPCVIIEVLRWLPKERRL